MTKIGDFVRRALRDVMSNPSLPPEKIIEATTATSAAEDVVRSGILPEDNAVKALRAELHNRGLRRGTGMLSPQQPSNTEGSGQPA